MASQADASQTDPNWPVGYRYECLHSYSDPNNNVPQGTRGKITQRHGVWAHVTMPFSQPLTGIQTAWVPVDRLKIGKTRRYEEDNIINVKQATMRLTNIPAPATGTDSQLRRALDHLSIAFRDNIDAMYWLPPWFVSRLQHESQRRDLINTIMYGMLPGPRQILEKKNFTIQELMNSLQPVTATDNQPVIYTIIYSDFKNDNRLPSQYIGKSVDPSQRDRLHLNSQEKVKHNQHYITARSAKKRIMGVICRISDSYMRTVAEQFFVLLFNSHTDAVYDFDPRAYAFQTAQAGVSPDNDKMLKYIGDKEQAVFMRDMARASFQRSQWPGGRDRPSYRASQGCNWKPPITEQEGNEKLIWVKQDWPEVNQTTYRHPPVKIWAGYTGKPDYMTVFIVKESDETKSLHTPGSFVGTIGTDPAFKGGDWVYPIIEMTSDGRPHPYNWTRLPSIGPYRDWDLARSWALKIEYQQADGTWIDKYLYSDHILRPRTPELAETGAFNSYSHGIAIYRFLKQIRLHSNGRPRWQYNYGVARLKETQLDWVNHMINVVDVVSRPSDIVRQSTLDDALTIATKYQNMGLNASRHWQAWDGYPTKVRTPVGACDSCYLLNIMSRYQDQGGRIVDRICAPHSRHKCERIPASGSSAIDICGTCRRLGRICTWTTAVDRCPMDDPRVLALVPQPSANYAATEIPDPQITRVLHLHHE